MIADHQQPGTASTFVPGHPRVLLACEYHGFNRPELAGSLATSAFLAPGPLVTNLNAGRMMQEGVAIHCPGDFGAQFLLNFGYANGTRLRVRIATAGCEFATNGDRSMFTPAATLTRLAAVLGHDDN